MGTKKITTNEFIERSKKIHDDFYDYSKSIYVNNITNVTIICPKHGEFKQKPAWHLAKHGCIKCGIIKTTKSKEKNGIDYIEKLKKIHNNKYDYSKFNYLGCHTKSLIICPIHGEFLQKPNSHLTGKGCPNCSKTKLLTNEDFIKKSQKIHNNFFTYLKTCYKNNLEKVIITCPIHGDFLQRTNSHLNGSGCKKCNSSYGEKKIRFFLQKNKINFVQEKKFDNCFFKKKLSFDFYLSEHNICIEFDGIQHYKPILNWGGEKGFKLIKKRDKIKTNFCNKEKINLLRISYREIDNIEKILSKHLITTIYQLEHERIN